MLKKILRKIYRKVLGVKRTRPLIIQIELAGFCTANCEFCDWTFRPKEQKRYMDTELALKAVKEAKEMGATWISFHVTGESLLHPDLFKIMPDDCDIGLSTNCLALEGEIARKIANQKNLSIILAILWAESKEKREKSLYNALRFLDSNPKCKHISVQMVTSIHASPFAKEMYDTFSPYMKKLPQLALFYKQPYSQDDTPGILGCIPEGVPESSRVTIDKMPTPQSCGTDCMAISPNPMTSMLIQSDGQIKPCFFRWPHWGLGNIRDTTLMEAWTSDRLKEIRSIWVKGDPDNKLACYRCIRSDVPRGDPVWWNTTGIVPTTLDCNQMTKGDVDDPYPQPEE